MVVFGFLAAVGVVEGVGGNGVPEGIGLLAGGVSIDDIAGSEVGLEDRLAESDEDEVLARVVVLKIEALEIAVVPGEVREGGSGLDDRLLGGVPVVMGSKETGGGCCEKCNQNNQGLVHLNMIRL